MIGNETFLYLISFVFHFKGTNFKGKLQERQQKLGFPTPIEAARKALESLDIYEKHSAAARKATPKSSADLNPMPGEPKMPADLKPDPVSPTAKDLKEDENAPGKGSYE